MKNRPRSFSRLVPLLVALAALTGLIVAVAPAGATPATSPPIEPLIPSENAGVQASAEPLAVTFTCPTFAAEEGEVIEEPEEEAVEETLEERRERAEREVEELEEEIEEPQPVVPGQPTAGSPRVKKGTRKAAGGFDADGNVVAPPKRVRKPAAPRKRRTPTPGN